VFFILLPPRAALPPPLVLDPLSPCLTGDAHFRFFSSGRDQAQILDQPFFVTMDDKVKLMRVKHCGQYFFLSASFGFPIRWNS
jgi:hypothetical protein